MKTSFSAVVLLLGAVGVVACSGSPSEDTSTTDESALRACAGGETVHGLDVSHYNGPVDWREVKKSGHGFGIAAIGDGMYEDPSFTKNWNEMKDAGLIRGAYQFFRAAEDPTRQARIVVAKVGRLGSGDLPVTIDLEGASIQGESRSVVVARAKEWISIVEDGTGKRPIIYTGKYVWDDSVSSPHFGGYPLWIAAYQSSCPLIPGGWADFSFWQYSDRGHVDGAGTGDVDIFNGTMAALEKLAGAPAAPEKSGGTAHAAAPSEPGCHSATLGEEVPNNTCVQSRTDRQWYQCDQGEWVPRFPDPDACASVHPL